MCQGVILQNKNGQCDPVLAFSYTCTVDTKLASSTGEIAVVLSTTDII